MINAYPSTDITIFADGFATGLVGTIGYRILMTTGVEYAARITTGIYEVGSLGAYGATATAPAALGDYIIVWDDAAGKTASETVKVIAEPAPPSPIDDTDDTSDHSQVIPTVADVGALLRARTKTPGGGEAGTFNQQTRPTDEQVASLIRKAVGTVSLTVGDVVPASLIDEVKEVTSIRAAMLVELSYFPEAVASDRSPYAQLKDLWDEAVGDDPDNPGWLVLAARRSADDGVMTIDQPGKAQWKFPPSRPLVW